MKNIVSLKLNKEFKRTYFQGKFKAHPLLVTYKIKNRNNTPRIGITTSKKIGCAVERNRARRIIRQAFVEIKNEDQIDLGSNDYVFVARNLTPDSSVKEIKKIMKKHISMLK